jgi:flavin reductase (DIM6/NTAB) family NADH-FMN oxidoreductase RutF
VTDADPADVAMPVTVAADRFKAAFRHHAAGVAVVTAAVDGQPIALTASSVTSVSADPAVLLLSASLTSVTGRALTRAGSAVVHLLDRDDLALAVRCADPEGDRFGDRSSWGYLPTGEPAYLAPRLLLRGVVVRRIALGEATVLLLAVTDVIDRRPDVPADVPGPLAYHDRRWHVLGDRSQVG